MGIREAILKELKEKGHKEGLEQGLEQGKEEKERAIILRAWKKGMPLEEIADLVDVPLTEVEGVISAYRTKNS